MKRLNYILVIIAIISVICAISLFNKEGYAINISSKNKELIKETLNGETLYITEGMFKLGELEKYIKENGHNLDDIGFVLIGISSLITLYLLGYKYINKNKAKR